MAIIHQSCSKCGDHREEDLAKYGYKPVKKRIKNLMNPFIFMSTY
jgi:hypothetical protein